jgi:ABC-type Fe3+-hydroxamate transport system substrate-binding protein
MRVVSMVPSWTETLLEAGVEVVGRTRFCIHPSEKIKTIPVVGGTKDIDWEKLKAIEFDFLLLDKEENLKAMADDASTSKNYSLVVTHIKKCSDVPRELRQLSQKFKNENLDHLASRWDIAIKDNTRTSGDDIVQLHQLDESKQKALGVLEWVRMPTSNYEQVVYVIWKNPYMTVTAETFVGSMLELAGLKTFLSENKFGKLYPEISLNQFDQLKTLFLFSSEPFPFHKKVADLKSQDIYGAVINGESYSWFGSRALSFLEKLN